MTICLCGLAAYQASSIIIKQVVNCYLSLIIIYAGIIVISPEYLSILHNKHTGYKTEVSRDCWIIDVTCCLYSTIAVSALMSTHSNLSLAKLGTNIIRHISNSIEFEICLMR